MTAATYNLPNHIKGDTFPGVSFTITVNGSPLDLTNATVRLYLRNKYKILKHRFSTDVAIGGMTITDPTNGIVRLDEQIVDVAAGTYNYDLEITLVTGEVYTYVNGTWTILQDVTYDG